MITNISSYKTMYNDNKYFLIHESVFQLYKKTYNKIFIVIIQEDV